MSTPIYDTLRDETEALELLDAALSDEHTRRVDALLASEDEQAECDACARGEHALCSDDGRSRHGCECARETHGPNGIGVV